jgi:hypothetical protein
MAKKEKEVVVAEETKKGPITKQLGKSGMGVGESIVAILKASKSKKGLTVAEVCTKMVEVYGEEKDATVSAQLSSKAPTRLGIEQGEVIEVIEGADPKARAYRYVGVATDEQKAEWKAAKKAAKEAKKAAKNAPADPAPKSKKGEDKVEENPYVDNSTENEDIDAEETPEEKAARKAAKKAAKKAKKGNK